MSFTKLDSGIVNSSIWSEPVATRVLWITILSMSDETGFVSTSVPGLIRAANISKEDFTIGIKALESPDPYSRTETNEGKRVEKVEGGWIIFNYIKYREREDKDAHREYMRKWREKKNCESQSVTVNHGESQNITVESLSASTSSSSSSSLNSNALMQGGEEWAAFKKIYPSQRGVYDPIAEHRFAKIVKDGKLEIVMHNVQWYANYIKYAGDSFVTQAAKWFESGACFEDWEPRARHAKSLIPREQLPVSQRPITDFL